MSFSKADRRQMLTIELVSIFLSKILAHHKKQLKVNKDEAEVLLLKINEDFQLCQRSLYALILWLRPKLALTTKQYDKYQKILKQIRELLIEVDKNALQGFNPIEYSNCLFRIVDARYEEAKKHNLLITNTWGDLYDGLYRMYYIFDAEMLDNNNIRLGHNLGKRIDALCNA